MYLSPRSKEILLEVADLIEANPDYYNQNDYVKMLKNAPATTCGTVCCVAGWIDYAVNGPKIHMEHVKKFKRHQFHFGIAANKLLELESYETDSLFGPDSCAPAPWDEMLAIYRSLATSKDPIEAARYRTLYAQTGAEMVRDFVRTND